MEYPENEILTLGTGRAETIHIEELGLLTESSENKLYTLHKANTHCKINSRCYNYEKMHRANKHTIIVAFPLSHYSNIRVMLITAVSVSDWFSVPPVTVPVLESLPSSPSARGEIVRVPV